MISASNSWNILDQNIFQNMPVQQQILARNIKSFNTGANTEKVRKIIPSLLFVKIQIATKISKNVEHPKTLLKNIASFEKPNGIFT